MAQKKAQVRKSEVHGHWVVVLRGGELEVEIPCGSKAEAQAVREQIAGGREGLTATVGFVSSKITMNGLAMRTATGRLYRAGKHRASVVIGPLGTEVDTYADAINASGGSDPRVDLMPSIAIGVGQGWGNAANLADMDQLYANITQMPLFRAKASPLVSKVHLGSLSMGGCVVYNWAIRHPEKVASIFTLVPPCSIQDIWDNNRLNLKSSIDTAFAGRPPDAYSLDKCDGSVLVGIPHRLYYSIADPIALPAFSIAWGEECGAEIFAMGGPGHSLDPTVYSMLDEAWWRHALD